MDYYAGILLKVKLNCHFIANKKNGINHTVSKLPQVITMPEIALLGTLYADHYCGIYFFHIVS